MPEKFQMISMQYDELPSEQIYHIERPWKIYRWKLILNSLPKHLDAGLVIQTKFFHIQRAHSVISAKFQVILSEFATFQKSGA